jgi:hypothetical protein
MQKTAKLKPTTEKPAATPLSQLCAPADPAFAVFVDEACAVSEFVTSDEAVVWAAPPPLAVLTKVSVPESPKKFGDVSKGLAEPELDAEVTIVVLVGLADPPDCFAEPLVRPGT